MAENPLIDLDAIKAVPKALKDAFIKPLKDMHRKALDELDAIENSAARTVIDIKRDPKIIASGIAFRNSLQHVRSEFTKAGGTNNEFDTLSNAVYTGHFGPVRPSP